MTPNEILIEVAKADGWKIPDDVNDFTWIENEDSSRMWRDITTLTPL